ncbi:type 1 glutamine amidotransferase domain-containing protein [Paenibacillus sp. GCM10023252]|uniref:type 1 glutamine amidotransferase domain-containing protein n=1 Tax=Paenibacillus sp. GCM10023252 TaxID=3252649 RepID=UPI00361E5285
MSEHKILIVVTNGKQLQDGKVAGLWLSEFAEPYVEFEKQGYDVTIASPLGGPSPIDPNSIQEGIPAEWNDLAPLLDVTVPLSAVTAKEYSGIFLPGGHGAMFDLPGDTHLQNLLTDFTKAGKPVAAVCHGPAGLVGAQLDVGNPLVEGKRLTGFTNEEEQEVGMTEAMPFLLEDKLRSLEAEFVKKPNWEPHVVVDGNLITGQNPQSSVEAARAFVTLIQHL